MATDHPSGDTGKLGFESVKELSFDDLCTMMGEASDLRRIDEEAIKQLDIHTLKAEWTGRMKAAAQAKGETLSDEQCDAVVGKYLEGLYAYRAPDTGLDTALAGLYVERSRIMRRIVLPAFAGATVLACIVGGAGLAASAYRAAEENSVEESVAVSYDRRAGLQRDIAGLQAEGADIADPQLRVYLQGAAEYLEGTDWFFETYYPGQDAEEAVTRENLPEVRERLIDVGNRLGLAGQAVDDAAAIVGLQQERETLAERADQLCASIDGMAVEAAAVQRGDELCAAADSYAASADADGLRSSVDTLANLQELLGQSYVLRIVNRDGMKSGIDRYYTEEGRTVLGGLYLLVEAIDANGRAVAVDIVNEENGETSRVTMWGERIPLCAETAESLYEWDVNAGSVWKRVANDKLDDGIIQDGVIGEKPAGYLTVTITAPGCDGGAPFGREGQITRW